MGSKTQKTTSTTKPPQYIEDAYKSLLSRAGDVSQTAYNPATEQQYQGLNPTQNQAFGAVQGAQGIQSPYIGQAGNMITGASGPISGAQIANYSNSFQQQVIDATMANINQNNALQQQQLRGNAALRGALGGDRASVAQAELARQQNLATNQTLAGLNQANYGQALSAAQADQNRALQGAGMYAGLGSQAQGAAYTDINALLGIGGQQQQEAQRASDITTANAQQQQQYPFNTTQWLAGITQGLGSSAGGTSTTTAPGPSVLGQIAGLGLTAAGLATGFPGTFSTLGTVASGMLGGSRNLSGLATGGIVEANNGAPASMDVGLHSKLMRLHHATKGIGAIQKANGGMAGQPRGIGTPNGYALGGQPEDDDGILGGYGDDSGDDDLGTVSPTQLAMLQANQGAALGLGRGANADLQTITTPGGAHFTVAKKVAPQFQGFLTELENSGYGIDPSQSGGYNDRNIAGTGTPSQHSYGNAIDLNWNANPRGGASNLPANIGDIAEKHGIAWGGNWKNPDPMHFEVSKLMDGNGAPVQMADASGAGGGQTMNDASPASPAATAMAVEQAQQSGVNLPLLAAGLGMLASKSPFPGVAIGEGGLQGVQELLKERQIDRQVAALKNQMATAQQRLGIQTEALSERKRHNQEIEKKAGQAAFSKNVIWGTDANGNPALIQPGTTGEAVQTKLPEGFKLAKDPIKVDAGTKWVLLDPQTRQPVGEIPKNIQEAAAEHAAGAEQGKISVEAKAALPQIETTTNQVLDILNRVESSPLRQEFTGYRGYLPNMTPAANDYQGLLDQIKGKFFLQAFQSLKGAGAITDVEGKKATDAFARLQVTAPSDKGFQSALDDARAAVKEVLVNARKRAGISTPIEEPASKLNDLKSKYGLD
ncbi:MAG TPA: M15 family metallopeptidase [Pseudolabrys sp.]